MEIRQTARGVELVGIKDFDLAQTLDCGQSFRWQQHKDGSFSGIAFERPLRILWEGENLLLCDSNEEEFDSIWRAYFDLDFDYGALKLELAGISPAMKEAVRYAPGMRLLRQEPWEALCSFILSQNNHIPRIKGIIVRLCEAFGRTLPGGGHAFPTAQAIANLRLEDLTPVRAGFRAKYILDAAQKVASGEIDLAHTASLPLDEARAELQKIRGIGPKVADCVLLYGLHRLEAFPKDVWMKRAMRVLFPGELPSLFGEYAGIAQQYLFHYSRMHPELFEPERKASSA